MTCRYLSGTLIQFNSRNSFTQILDILSNVSRTLCIYFVLLEILILVSLKDLETKLYRHRQKEVVSMHYIKVDVKGVLKKRFCLCQNLRCEFILSITFKANDSPERLSSKIHPRYLAFACCLISMPLTGILRNFQPAL